MDLKFFPAFLATQIIYLFAKTLLYLTILSALLQINFYSTYLSHIIMHFIEDSKLNSQIGSDDQGNHWENGPQSSSISRQVPKKRSKIQQLLLDLAKAQAQLRVIAKNHNLKQDEIALAFRRGLKALWNIDGMDLLEKGKELLEICQILAFQLNEEEDISPEFQRLKIDQKNQERERMFKSKIKQEQKPRENQSQKIEIRQSRHREVGKQQETQKTVKRQPRMQKEEEKKPIVRQNIWEKNNKKSERISENILNNEQINLLDSTDEHIQKVRGICRLSQADPPVGKVENKGLQDVYYTVVWEDKVGLKATGREIKKLSQTSQYENICAKEPLKNGVIYRIKFKVLQYGTLAIGLLPSNYKYKKQKCVAVEKQNALKYIAFENGGGQIQCGGEIWADGRHVGLQNNMDLEMIFNSKDMVVTFKSERLGEFTKVLPASFKNYNLYLYFEMKQKHTHVEFYS